MFRKLFSNCAWYQRETADQTDQQYEQQFFKRKTRRIQKSVTETTLTSTLTSESDTFVGATGFKHDTETHINPNTPVLFSTDRGLHLRLPKPCVTSNQKTHPDNDETSELYDIIFCDLERWSTNRAHIVSLEDTFTIAHRSLEPVEEHPTTSSKLYFTNNRNSEPIQCNDSHSHFPAKRSIPVKKS